MNQIRIRNLWIGLFSIALLHDCSASSGLTAGPPDPQFFCNGQKICEKYSTFDLMTFGGSLLGVSLDVCRLTCGKYGSLWPRPTGRVEMTKFTVPINYYFIHFYHNTGMDDMQRIFEVFNRRWKLWYGSKPLGPEGHQLLIVSNVTNPSTRLEILRADESYTLEMAGIDSCSDAQRTGGVLEWSEIQVHITANTIYGARAALETLSQLMTYDPLTNTVQMVCQARITDSPAFKYRGLLLDVSRRFYPMHVIRSMVNAMSYSKFNVLHLHLSDSQSFPVELHSWPNLTNYGAYSSKQVYTRRDLITLAHYAHLRGIVIVPEIDAPSHVAAGWEWGEMADMGKLLLCHEKINSETCFGPPCGYLNPANPNVYRILKDIYGELIGHFGSSFQASEHDFFHIGGDEVSFKCWQKSKEVTQWMERSGILHTDDGFFRAWATFEARAMDMLTAANQNHTPWTMLWSSRLTKKGKLAQLLFERMSKLIVEYWGTSNSSEFPDLLEEGYSVVVANSDAWYLDCGVGSWVGEGPNWCNPYKDWRLMYNNSPYRSITGAWEITDDEQKRRILGGEGCIWSETVSPENLEQRIWPRAAAIAERLWSDPKECWVKANSRMAAHKDRLLSRGVQTDPIEPEWCPMHGDNCIVEPEKMSFFKMDTTCPEYQVKSRPSRSPSSEKPPEAIPEKSGAQYIVCTVYSILLSVVFSLLTTPNFGL